jgi:hypothetical protein
VDSLFLRICLSWPLEINHNNKRKPDKILRYEVGNERLSLLRLKMEFFAFGDTEQGKNAAFLAKVNEFDLDYRMPKDTRYEYLAGRETQDGKIILFSYIWFCSLSQAKEYVLKKGMKLVGGWSSED